MWDKIIIPMYELYGLYISHEKPMGFLSDSGHVRAVMHAGIAN